jgi:hypothetical protein
VLWSIYLSRYLPVPDQFSIRPLGEWHFDLLPGLLRGMGADLHAGPFFYLLLIAATVLGWIVLLRRSVIPDERLALMLAAVGVALPIHFISLCVAYLGTGFSEVEIRRAASLHRYMSHVGFAACVLAMTAVVSFLMRRAAHPGALSAGKGAVIAGLALYALPMGFNVLLPSVFAGSNYLKKYEGLNNSARALSRSLPAQDTVAIFGPDWAINFGGYHMWFAAHGKSGPLLKDRKIVASAADLPRANEKLQQWMADESIHHIWLFDAQVLNAALGHEPARHIIWSRSTGQWRVVQDTPGPR